MKTKTLFELRKTNDRITNLNENMRDKNERSKFGGNLYDYALAIQGAIRLWKNGDYETVNTIIELVNTGFDILHTDIVPRGSHKIDSMTKNTQSNKPLTREILQANYRVSNTFNGVSLNTINDNLPVRLSDHALSKLIRQVFPDVQERKCTNDIKYNLECA